MTEYTSVKQVWRWRSIPVKSRQTSRGSQYYVTVILCALNEEANLGQVIPKIPDFVDEVILVDGGSTNGTVHVAKESMPDIIVLTQSGKGKGDALRCGFEAVRGDIIATLDADGSTDPNELRNFIEPLLDGYDFAKGTRLAGGIPADMPLHRWIGNKTIVWLTNRLFNTRYTDMCSGYNAFWTRCIHLMHFKGDGYEDEPLMIVRATKAKLRIVEVPCKYYRRITGESKSPALRQAWKSLKTILRERLLWDNRDVLDRFRRKYVFSIS